MSSFVKNPMFQRGNKLVTTGIPDLDNILGGGMSRGTTFLLLEDEYSSIHSLFLKVFLSEMNDLEQEAVVIIKEENEVEIFEKGGFKNDMNQEKMVIAWRYQNLELQENKFKFNLSKKKEYRGKKLTGKDLNLEKIIDFLKQEKALNITAFSLFSPAWYELKYSDLDILKFLYDFKEIVRKNNHVAMVSIPGFFREKINYHLYFDIVFHINSHLFTGICSNYKGIFEIEKNNKYSAVSVNSLETSKYGIKIKKEKIVIEKINIPPEETVKTESSCDQKLAF